MKPGGTNIGPSYNYVNAVSFNEVREAKGLIENVGIGIKFVVFGTGHAITDMAPATILAPDRPEDSPLPTWMQEEDEL